MKATLVLLAITLASARSASAAILVPGSVLQTWTELCSKDPTGNWALTKEVKSCGRGASGRDGCSLETVYFKCPTKKTESSMQPFPSLTQPLPAARPFFGQGLRRSSFHSRLEAERRGISKKIGDWIQSKCCDLKVSCPPRPSRRSPFISRLVSDLAQLLDNGHEKLKSFGRDQMKKMCCDFNRPCPFGPTKQP